MPVTDILFPFFFRNENEFGAQNVFAWATNLISCNFTQQTVYVVYMK